MRHARSHLTYANVMATVAAFIALGGGATAATLVITGKNVKNNSLTSADIKNNSLRSGDVRNGSLLSRDFRTGQLPRGATGPQGVQGPQGVKGDPGAPGGFVESLPSGKTVRGPFGLGGQTGSAGGGLVGHIQFPFALLNAPTPHYIATGTGAPAECPGTGGNPQAAPGHLCVYEAFVVNAATRIVKHPVTNATNEATPFGAALHVTSVSANMNVEIRGTWAVTAP